MNKIYRILTPIFALFIALCSILPSGSFAETEDTIIREYEFQTGDKDDLHYPAIEEITVNGDTYRLTGVSYDIVAEKEPVSVEKKVKTDDPDDYDRTITENIDGVRYTLTAEKPEWTKKKNKRQIRTIRKEYRDGKSPPEQITTDGEVYRIEHREVSVRKEAFHAPAVFYAKTTDTTLYRFNGKLVEIIGSDPIWNGYEDDIRDYLGLNGNSYTITGMQWDGGFQSSENGYVRTATVKGSKRIPIQTVTYTNDAAANDSYEYTARIRYVDKESLPEFTARATVTYGKVEKGLSKRAMIIIGAGTAVLCLTIAVLLYFLARRYRREDYE